tara:strand:+ start:382 stop:1641 length:1260 start_codon:yes stop_codon:yes gene_type:complete
MNFQFDGRSRLEAGIDGIAEIMIDGEPQARMIAVQIKTTESVKYTAETEHGFTYLLEGDDLAYWHVSNLPVIIVLYRVSDETYYWKDVSLGVGEGSRKLSFSKFDDVLDHTAVDRLAALTVPKHGAGYYVPPLGGGEDALVNMLPIKLPNEIFVASTSFDGKKATSVLLDSSDSPRFDWAIKGGSFWSFHDPREEVTREIVDLDQVEAIDTASIAFHEDIHEMHNFAFLLRNTLQHQFRDELRWDKAKKLFHFLAKEKNTSRAFTYDSAKKRATTTVVNVVQKKANPERVAFVRHHAFVPRFECFGDEWNLIITPTYHFTTNGFIPHSYPDALLSGKKRLDNNASLRGQLIMWNRLLSRAANEVRGLFDEESSEVPILAFGGPPVLTLPTTVPEDAWGRPKVVSEQEDSQQAELWKDAV